MREFVWLLHTSASLGSFTLTELLIYQFRGVLSALDSIDWNVAADGNGSAVARIAKRAGSISTRGSDPSL